MNKRMRTNLLLAAAVAGLALFAWLGPAPEEKTRTWPLLDIPREAIAHISVSEDGAVKLSLEKTESGWRITRPFDHPADEFQVDMLLDDLTQLAPQRYVLNEIDTSETGLDESTLRVTVNGSELVFGNQTPLGTSRYIRRGEHVYLASDLLKFRLKERPATDYASKHLLPRNAEIESVTLPSGLKIGKSGSGWTLTPENDRISADDLQKLIDAWRSVQATQAISGDSVAGDRTVSILLRDRPEPLVFHLAQDENSLYVVREDSGLKLKLPLDQSARLLQLEPDNGRPPNDDRTGKQE